MLNVGELQKETSILKENYTKLLTNIVSVTDMEKWEHTFEEDGSDFKNKFMR